ncbi:hypothetical protein HUO09_17355 [Vibrio sp. Y2-5]|uniref:hypothetical protein n=1 Tax=Vibrio sp. Y2-5 TaxID=2743977 RepID=UPI0016616EFA|nr:hypothetical protein [Vibrio sp. Y2-5]MBD0788124.1 hypothetical protein [Vibrio sp. Y2-5]
MTSYINFSEYAIHETQCEQIKMLNGIYACIQNVMAKCDTNEKELMLKNMVNTVLDAEQFVTNNQVTRSHMVLILDRSDISERAQRVLNTNFQCVDYKDSKRIEIIEKMLAYKDTLDCPHYEFYSLMMKVMLMAGVKVGPQHMDMREVSDSDYAQYNLLELSQLLCKSLAFSVAINNRDIKVRIKSGTELVGGQEVQTMNLFFNNRRVSNVHHLVINNESIENFMTGLYEFQHQH